MIQLRSRLKVADNTGAREIAVFGVSGKNKRRWARLGDIIAASVKIASPKGQVKKGDLVLLASFGAGFTWGATLLNY